MESTLTNAELIWMTAKRVGDLIWLGDAATVGASYLTDTALSIGTPIEAGSFVVYKNTNVFRVLSFDESAQKVYLSPSPVGVISAGDQYIITKNPLITYVAAINSAILASHDRYLIDISTTIEMSAGQYEYTLSGSYYLVWPDYVHAIYRDVDDTSRYETLIDPRHWRVVSTLAAPYIQFDPSVIVDGYNLRLEGQMNIWTLTMTFNQATATVPLPSEFVLNYAASTILLERDALSPMDGRRSTAILLMQRAETFLNRNARPTKPGARRLSTKLWAGS